MRDLIAMLYEYGIWANARLLSKAERLTGSQLTQRFTQGADSILGTFTHLVSADWRWYDRWRGVTPRPMLTAADLPTLQAVRARWEALYPERRAYLASLDAAALDETLRWTRDGQSSALPRWQALVHCANHGTQHRSEIAAMLTDAGHSPGDLDLLFFCLEGHAP